MTRPIMVMQTTIKAVGTTSRSSIQVHDYNVTTGLHTSITADASGYLPAICTAPTLASLEANLTAIALLSGDLDDDAKFVNFI